MVATSYLLGVSTRRVEKPAEQPDAASVRAQHRQAVQTLEDKYPKAAEHLDEAREDILTFAAYPKAVWRRAGRAGRTEQPNPSKKQRSATRSSQQIRKRAKPRRSLSLD
ncbi:transposase [Nonomuraea sp. NPDC005983]|uniref:transposase n=1 Tax=Nonomuraea sp. NPDC005983 TaxID=3155595 RepID=UPI0033B706FD